jgi:hypothetical protein
MLALVMLIAILVPAGPLDLDRSWSQAMHHLETPLLTDLALVFNWLGGAVGRAIALTLTRRPPATPLAVHARILVMERYKPVTMARIAERAGARQAVSR